MIKWLIRRHTGISTSVQEEQGSMENRVSLLSEFWSFLKQNKKWWLIPLLLVILLFVGLAIFSGSPVAPFIYTLF